MRKLILRAEFEHDESNLATLSSAFAEFCRDLHKLGFKENAHWYEDRPLEEMPAGFTATESEPVAEIKQAAEMPVDFASAAAAELADSLNLKASDFKGLKPSGKTGYTIADVRKVAG